MFDKKFAKAQTPFNKMVRSVTPEIA